MRNWKYSGFSVDQGAFVPMAPLADETAKCERFRILIRSGEVRFSGLPWVPSQVEIFDIDGKCVGIVSTKHGVGRWQVRNREGLYFARVQVAGDAAFLPIVFW